MIRRNTWIVLAVFAVILAMIWVIPLAQSRLPQTTPTPTSAPRTMFPSTAIAEVTMTGLQGHSVTVQSSGNNTWKVTSPKDITIDTTQIAGAIGALTGLTIQTDMPLQPPADSMGLTTPADVITIKFTDGTQTVMQVGKVSATGTGVYVQIKGSPAVVVNKNDMDSVLQLLTLTIPTATPSAEAPTEAPSVAVTEVPTIETPTQEPSTAVTPASTGAPVDGGPTATLAATSVK
jgi:hypothetical protein